MQYRPEIDGLRAIAVVGVILFHAGLEAVGGGFLGVDVFFVISGYLITGVILQDLRLGVFSAASFYERRFRRIIPALNVTMLLCIPAAFVLLLPDDLENFGQSLVATASFGNNILLMVTAGYFQLAVDFKPLMHTWSLGVEEHYYLLIPILISAAFAASARRGAAWMTAGVCLASFAFCLWVSRRAPDANFYLVFSRAWELGAGGLAVIAEPSIRARLSARRGMSEALGLLGLAMIVASLCLFNSQMLLPGWPSLLPVVGTSLVLLTAAPGNLAGRLLAARPLVFAGLLSYSAYLYHQPIFAFVRVARLSEPPTWLMVLLILPVFCLAWLSWRFVERPFRDRRFVSLRAAAIFGLATTGLIVAIGLALHFTSGFLNMRPELAVADPQFGSRQNASYNEGPFRFQDKPFNPAGSDRAVLVIGNSYARDFINMGLETGRLKDGSLSYAVGAGYDDMATCPLAPGVLRTAARADLVVIATSFSSPDQFGCMDAQIRQLETATDAPVYVLGLKNFGWNNNAVMRLPKAIRYGYRAAPLAQVAALNAQAAQRYGSRYIDLLSKISDARGRVPVFTPEKRFISQDSSHLTEAGAAYLGEILFRDPALSPVGQ